MLNFLVQNCRGLHVSLAGSASGHVFLLLLLSLLSPVCLGGAHRGLPPFAHARGLIVHLLLVYLITWPLLKVVA